MAIKVNGTTVIDDSRNLANVGGLKTVNGTSLVGSGNISAGASTTYGAVGTYVVAQWQVASANTNYDGGTTVSGSTLRYITSGFSSVRPFVGEVNAAYVSSAGLSGTWRFMAPRTKQNNTETVGSFFVRIS